MICLGRNNEDGGYNVRLQCDGTHSNNQFDEALSHKKVYNFIKSSLNSYKELRYLAVSQLLKARQQS